MEVDTLKMWLPFLCMSNHSIYLRVSLSLSVSATCILKTDRRLAYRFTSSAQHIVGPVNSFLQGRNVCSFPFSLRKRCRLMSVEILTCWLTDRRGLTAGCHRVQPVRLRQHSPTPPGRGQRHPRWGLTSRSPADVPVAVVLSEVCRNGLKGGETHHEKTRFTVLILGSGGREERIYKILRIPSKLSCWTAITSPTYFFYEILGLCCICSMLLLTPSVSKYLLLINKNTFLRIRATQLHLFYALWGARLRQTFLYHFTAEIGAPVYNYFLLDCRNLPHNPVFPQASIGYLKNF